MIDRVGLKSEAKDAIKGNIFPLLFANLIVMIITGASLPVNSIPFLGQIVSIAVMVVYFGLALFYLNYIDKGTTDYMDLFYSFKVKDLNTYFKHLGTLVIKFLLIILWTLLFIVPGIIKAIAYSQVNYIRAEKSDQDMMDCLKESEELMDGHKMEYFILQLSFIGWWMLGALTLGILYIYVIPYYTATMTLYYRKLRPAVDEVKSQATPLDKEPEIT